MVHKKASHHLEKGGTFSKLQSVPHCWTVRLPSQRGRQGGPWRSGRWCKVLGRLLHHFYHRRNVNMFGFRNILSSARIPTYSRGRGTSRCFQDQPRTQGRRVGTQLDCPSCLGFHPQKSFHWNRRLGCLSRCRSGQGRPVPAKNEIKICLSFINYIYSCSHCAISLI